MKNYTKITIVQKIKITIKEGSIHLRNDDKKENAKWSKNYKVQSVKNLWKPSTKYQVPSTK